MDIKKIEELEEELEFLDDEENEMPPTDIVAFNELRSCADIYRMYDSGVLEIQPSYQREIVWKDASQTRFIDSLTKQLPIPSLCFSYDYKTEKRQVVDGLQRIYSIIRFLTDDNWVLSRLADIDSELCGKRVLEFKDKNSPLHKYFLKVENMTLPITVLRCDYSKRSHLKYLFKIFHRLNSGGVKLNNQEIRNCIYAGNLNNLLKELNQNKYWVAINHIQPNKPNRFVTEELILRIFAFNEKLDCYNGRLANFLNNYMENNKNISKENIDIKRKLFTETTAILYDKIFEKNINIKYPKTIIETVMIGILQNISKLKEEKISIIKSKFNNLLKSKYLSEEELRESLSATEKVNARIKESINIFGE